ncbi:hypothetical protein FMEAI12_7130003 [Parafrankia sp. Ea1.12]|nr:hypothetical protein FMEAI12_7130003 [Parafrankia sp. Ea1.12]
MTEGTRRRLGLICPETRARALDLRKEVGVPDPERRLSADHEARCQQRAVRSARTATRAEPRT